MTVCMNMDAFSRLMRERDTNYLRAKYISNRFIPFSFIYTLISRTHSHSHTSIHTFAAASARHNNTLITNTFLSKLHTLFDKITKHFLLKIWTVVGKWFSVIANKIRQYRTSQLYVFRCERWWGNPTTMATNIVQCTVRGQNSHSLPLSL